MKNNFCKNLIIKYLNFYNLPKMTQSVFSESNFKQIKRAGIENIHTGV
jgi:hypothetical protein